jgi:hypothetical protein
MSSVFSIQILPSVSQERKKNIESSFLITEQISAQGAAAAHFVSSGAGVAKEGDANLTLASQQIYL